MALTQKTVVVAIALFVAALHFVVGPNYRGPFPGLVNGYLIDLLLPFAMFLVMGFVEIGFVKQRVIRALLVFGVGATFRANL